MFLTQDDYRKIEEWLHKRTVKDTQFQNADPLTGKEKVPIIQGGKNRISNLDTFIKELSLMGLQDFLNMTDFLKKGYLRLEEAVNAVPVNQRKLGLVITFHSEKGNWMIYQFKGTSLNQWSSLNYWRSIIEEAIEGYLYFPDEEDITGVKDENRIFLKFKDKDYDPKDFSGMGRIMLRKNYVGTEACSIDDEDHLNNILTQDMISEENTVYIIQYDFDLNGETISIPRGCTLWFQGGSINNGTINVNEAAILGAFEFADMGDATLFGKFNTGQIMTFSDDSYQAKKGGYFIPSTKRSSATVEEDAKNEDEVFYEKNPEAYVTETRQELRWWNGEEWILILDITDYKELLSIISDLIEKHNAEMSECYKYFKKRCYALEKRMDSAEHRLNEHDQKLAEHDSRITKNETDIQNIQENISDIQENITNIEENVSSFTNNITEVTGDIEGLKQLLESLKSTVDNLDIESVIENYLQNYTPEGGDGGVADSTKGTLYFKGAVTASFNGSEDVTVTIPSGEGGGEGSFNGGTADKVSHKLKFTGASTAEYDGSKEVTVNIPVGSNNENSNGGTGVNKTLTVKQGETPLGTYNGTQDVTITIPENVKSADKVNHKLKFTGAETKEYDGSTEVTVNIPKTDDKGDAKLLYCAHIKRSSNKTTAWSASTHSSNHATATIKLNNTALEIKLSATGGVTLTVTSVVAVVADTTSYSGPANTSSNVRSHAIGLRCSHANNTIYIQGIRNGNKDNDTSAFDDLVSGRSILGIEVAIFGKIS